MQGEQGEGKSGRVKEGRGRHATTHAIASHTYSEIYFNHMKPLLVASIPKVFAIRRLISMASLARPIYQMVMMLISFTTTKIPDDSDLIALYKEARADAEPITFSKK